MNRSEIAAFLATVDPFDSFSAAVREELAAGAGTKTFDAKEIIFHEQSEGETGYIVVEGRVALLKTSPNGKELIVELLGAHELFALVVLLESRPYPLTARAQIKTSVISFRRTLVQPVIERHPELYRGFTSLLSRRVQSSHNLARALAHDRREVRAASILMALAAKSGDQPLLGIGRQELADLCGITIETASRVMKGFEKEGLVDLTELGAVRILDLPALRRIAESEELPGQQ